MLPQKASPHKTGTLTSACSRSRIPYRSVSAAVTMSRLSSSTRIVPITIASKTVNPAIAISFVDQCEYSMLGSTWRTPSGRRIAPPAEEIRGGRELLQAGVRDQPEVWEVLVQSRDPLRVERRSQTSPGKIQGGGRGGPAPGQGAVSPLAIHPETVNPSSLSTPLRSGAVRGGPMRHSPGCP